VSARPWVVAGVALGVLAAVTSRYERCISDVSGRYAEDMAQIGALMTARTALETSVLETRAGIRWSFDAVNRAVVSLRGASRLAAVVRSRGTVYAEAADALDRLSDETQAEEVSIETFKTDLALLRLASRNFPVAVDALSHPDAASSRAFGALRADLNLSQTERTPEVTWRIASGLAAYDVASAVVAAGAAKIGALRADVERYEEAPTREVAEHLETEIAAIEASRESFPEAVQSDLTVLLGHTRVIIDRRERVDRTVRVIVRSAARVDAEVARAAYERASRHEHDLALVLRIGAGEVAVAALALFAGTILRTIARRRRKVA
jgi:cell division protein FtsB